MSTGDLEQFLATHAALIGRLYRQAEGDRWQLPQPVFAEALHRSASRRFAQADVAAREIARYLESLHVGDLALACACAAGGETAWDHFVEQFRPKLYAAARAIAGDAAARELADSLYADLFGLEQRGGARRSLLEHFHGRSSLATWLRAVLAQRQVDRVRASRRTAALDEEARSRLADPKASGPDFDADPDRPRYLARLRSALTNALAALEPRDRLRLAYYYAEELRLAEIGRLLGEHEATVSRKLERARKAVRRHVEDTLRGEHRMNEAQVALCFEYALEEWPFDLTAELTKPER